MEKYSIKDIEEILNNINNLGDPLIYQIQSDERVGVQRLLQKWSRKMEQNQKLQDQFDHMTVYEKEAREKGFHYIAGIDEVGRGPLAGPVVAAAVILPEDLYLPGLNDSKKLSAEKREELNEKILKNAISIGIGVVSSEEIDKINILQATKKAMLQAVSELRTFPDYLLIDALELDVPIMQRSLIKGDALSVSIAAASIIAKVYRDRLMTEYSKKYPEYQFDKNMGYGTKEHMAALEKNGPIPIHRKSFSPIKEMVGTFVK